jgi:phage head maturation protease
MKRKINILQGRGLLEPASFNDETREVDVVFATETPVHRMNWVEEYIEILLCNPDAMRMERANRGLPVLNSHNSSNLQSQLGRSTQVWTDTEKKECRARIRFSVRDELTPIIQDIKAGIIRDISVGYRVYQYEKKEPEGQDKLAIYRATDWEPFEISFVSCPADINSSVRYLENTNTVEITVKNSNKLNMGKEEKRMEYEVSGSPVKEGDEIEVDGVVYIAKEDGEPGDTIQLEPRQEEEEEEEGRTEEEEEKEEERSAGHVIPRIDAIVEATRAAHLPDSFAIELFKSNRSLEECRIAILEKAIRKQPKIDGWHASGLGVDALDKKRAAIQEAILNRVYPARFKLKPGNEFRGLSLVEMGKELLKERGVSTRGLDKGRVADLVFKRAHSSTDFPILFEGAIDKMLRADYEFAPEFWNLIARQTSVSDFREKNMYQVESLNGMTEVAEGGEIPYTTLVEGKASIRLKSYAEGIKFTRQAFINDDLKALAIIPDRFIKDWDYKRGDLVWSLIIENVILPDDNALFSAAHKNLITGAAGALSENSLAAAQLLMRTQLAIDGKRRIRVTPKYLIVPPQLEVRAKKLLTAITPVSTLEVNVFANAFDIIVEDRLADPDAWYLSADPAAIDSLYYAYLEGGESLRVSNEDDFNTDSMKYAVRGDFGTAAIDYRGLVKANGK